MLRTFQKFIEGLDTPSGVQRRLAQFQAMAKGEPVSQTDGRPQPTKYSGIGSSGTTAPAKTGGGFSRVPPEIAARLNPNHIDVHPGSLIDSIRFKHKKFIFANGKYFFNPYYDSRYNQ